MTRGRFVVFEGGDGSGKSTQAGRLAHWLRAQGLAVHETFEPGAGATGAVIRELLLHGPEAIEPTAEALLMAADRAQHVAARDRAGARRVASGSCATGTSLRRSCTREWCAGSASTSSSSSARSRPTASSPTSCSCSTSPTPSRRARQGDEPDRLEREGVEFHAAVRAAYRDLAPARGWVVLDGNGDLDDVGERVRAAVAPLLAG